MRLKSDKPELKQEVGMAVQSGSKVSRRGIASPTGNQVQETAQQATQAAGVAIEKVGEQAKQTAATQKDRIADGLDATANAIRQTGQSVKQEQPMVADYAEKAALRVDRVSGYLRQHDVDEVITDVQGYARANKGMFIAGTLLLGFMTARLIKTAGRRQQLAQSSTSQSTRIPVSSSRYVPMGNSAMEVEADDAYALDAEPLETGTVTRARTNGN
jgi:gas vesicle protein